MHRVVSLITVLLYFKIDIVGTLLDYTYTDGCVNPWQH